MFKKVLASVMSILFLCGCTVSVKNNSDDNTTSNIIEPTTEEVTSTTVEAEPVDSLSNLSIEKIVWGVGSIKDHAQPNEPKTLDSRFESLDARWLLDDEKSICLTFDEGYENGYTPAILDTLKDKKVKAVFFVTYDFVSQNPELVSRMINDGHVVGNHTWHHYDMTTIDTETARDEIAYLHNYIKEKYNYTMSYFRFPEGCFSQQNLGLLKDMGYKSVFWSYAYADWDPNNQTEPTKAFTNICESTHAGEILLLHAVSKTNADILGKVIDDLHQQGYEFTTKI